MKYRERVLLILINKFVDLGGPVPMDVCVNISYRAEVSRVGFGRSSYAKRRRAQAIGRCHRCYRVWPPFYFTTRCDNKTCVPPITYNLKVYAYIQFGVTEVIPE
uniref:RNA silencing suppressor n=1 Tax=Soybean carlavirus 1 TaxID=2796532 RepID=A0A7T8G207_9VIRU|nr:nucleic acid binding protein [Soybean carlavirus 1]